MHFFFRGNVKQSAVILANNSVQKPSNRHYTISKNVEKTNTTTVVLQTSLENVEVASENCFLACSFRLFWWIMMSRRSSQICAVNEILRHLSDIPTAELCRCYNYTLRLAGVYSNRWNYLTLHKLWFVSYYWLYRMLGDYGVRYRKLSGALKTHVQCIYTCMRPTSFKFILRHRKNAIINPHTLNFPYASLAWTKYKRHK